MKLSEYFENNKGIGVLATADDKGVVNVAIYARPHFIDEETVAFIMADRLSHKNLETNPYAAFLFKKEGEGYEGKRLYLKKIKEEKNTPLIETLIKERGYKAPHLHPSETKYLVYFHIEKILPLIGSDK
jgi:hypothetical protein